MKVEATKDVDVAERLAECLTAGGGTEAGLPSAHRLRQTEKSDGHCMTEVEEKAPKSSALVAEAGGAVLGRSAVGMKAIAESCRGASMPGAFVMAPSDFHRDILLLHSCWSSDSVIFWVIKNL